MGIYEAYEGVPGNSRIGKDIAAALGQRHSVLMRYHGALTVGQSIEAAAFLFLELEKCAEEQIKAIQTYGDDLPTIDPETAQGAHDYLTTGYGLWLSFRGEYHKTCKDHNLSYSFWEA